MPSPGFSSNKAVKIVTPVNQKEAAAIWELRVWYAANGLINKPTTQSFMFEAVEMMCSDGMKKLAESAVSRGISLQAALADVVSRTC